MRRMTAVLVSAVAAVVLVAGGAYAAAAPRDEPRPMTFLAVDSRVGSHEVDVAPAGEGPGDIFMFQERLYRGTVGGTAVGHTEVVCQVTARTALRCNGTLFLAGGKIEAGGAAHYS